MGTLGAFFLALALEVRFFLGAFLEFFGVRFDRVRFANSPREFFARMALCGGGEEMSLGATRVAHGAFRSVSRTCWNSGEVSLACRRGLKGEFSSPKTS